MAYYLKLNPLHLKCVSPSLYEVCKEVKKNWNKIHTDDGWQAIRRAFLGQYIQTDFLSISQKC